MSKPWWLLGYFIPLALVVAYAAAMRDPRLSFIPPFSWLVLGRNKFAVIGFIAALLLTTPLSRLPQRRVRLMVALLMIVIVSCTSIWPFLAPAFNRDYLAHLQTRMDDDGICRQSNDYNCGPAAAVTALRWLGFPAEEGQIAILAHTSTATGTPPDVLARALQDHCGKDGLVAEYRLFKNVDGLLAAGPTLAVIKYTFMLDHYVTVLEVTDRDVVVGDPLNGKTSLARAEFEKRWRFLGVVLKRKVRGSREG